MYTLSKVNHEERDGLVQQREILLDKLNELQFKLFDKSSPEVVDHVNQLQMERAKQQSLLKQAQAKLNQLEPELENFEEGAEHILLEAISQQDWYGFKNKRELVFDKRTGILYPNFEFIKLMSFEEFQKNKRNFSLNGLNKYAWTHLGGGIWEKYYQDRLIFKFPKNKKGDYSFSRVVLGVYEDQRYGITSDERFGILTRSGATGIANDPVLPCLEILENTEISEDNKRLTVSEKAKIILFFFIEQDWIPNFEPFLEKESNEEQEEFQERLNQAQQQCDVYNQIFDAYYQRIQLQKKLADLELQLAELPEPEPKNIFTSEFDYRIELKNYDSQIINQSVWKYSQASQQWISSLLNNIDGWESEHLNLVKNTVELNHELDKKLPVSINITAEEKKLLEMQLQHLKECLDLGLTPLRTSLINFLSESQQISSNLEQTSSLNGLAQLEHQTRPSFELLAEHTAILCTKTLKKMEWLDQSLDFVKSVVNILRRSAENYLILVDKYQQDLMQIGLENSIESEEVEAWFVEWRRERLTLLKQIQPLLDAGLNNVIDEQTVLDIFSCIEQYQNELDQFYLQKRLGIHTTYAFQPNGHRQEKLEKEQELTKLVHQFMQQLENVIFSTKTTAQKIWLIRFSEVWQNGIVNQITDFLTKEQLIERDDVVQIMSEELRKVQQQNLAACLQDAQSYSDALAQREKDVNTLIFKMRKALMK